MIMGALFILLIISWIVVVWAVMAENNRRHDEGDDYADFASVYDSATFDRNYGGRIK